MKPFTDLEFAKSFHGHFGPYLVIGIKMGNRAVTMLGADTCFHLKAEVRCAAGPPPSCVLDGIQLSTGCTMGKKNISHIVSDDGVEAVFTNTDTGQSVTIRVNESFINQAVRRLNELGEEEASLMTWNAKDDEVFTACAP